ncbi:MAG: gamma-glutamylcyclotransferase [Phenylobacterium sp.]
MNADCRLAVYGSLAPGKSNHHQLAGLAGEWRAGVVRGERVEAGWGTAGGFPGLKLDADGGEVAVQVFTSADLPQHWARLDRFEGADYRRVTTEVMTADGPLAAQVYVVG